MFDRVLQQTVTKPDVRSVQKEVMLEECVTVARDRNSDFLINAPLASGS